MTKSQHQELMDTILNLNNYVRDMDAARSASIAILQTKMDAMIARQDTANGGLAKALGRIERLELAQHDDDLRHKGQDKQADHKSAVRWDIITRLIWPIVTPIIVVLLMAALGLTGG